MPESPAKDKKNILTKIIKPLFSLLLVFAVIGGCGFLAWFAFWKFIGCVIGLTIGALYVDSYIKQKGE